MIKSDKKILTIHIKTQKDSILINNLFILKNGFDKIQFSFIQNKKLIKIFKMAITR